MGYEDLLRLYSGQDDVGGINAKSFAANGFNPTDFNAEQNTPQLAQGLLGKSQQQNQANLQNMQAITEQGIQQGMANNQQFQANRDAQASATQAQLQQKIAQDEAQKRQMMGMALTFATGGFGGAGAAEGSAANAGANEAAINTAIADAAAAQYNGIDPFNVFGKNQANFYNPYQFRF